MNLLNCLAKLATMVIVSALFVHVAVASPNQQIPIRYGSAGLWINSGTPYPEILNINQYLIVASERNTASSDYSTSWDQWCAKVGRAIDERWSSAIRPGGRVDIKFGVSRSWHIMYATINGGYTGYPEMAQQALAFVRSLEGRTFWQFPKDTRASEVHLSLTLTGTKSAGTLPWRKYVDTQTPHVSYSVLKHNIELYKQMEQRHRDDTIATFQNQIDDPRSSKVIRDRAAFEIQRLKMIQQRSNE